jgi:hypothetical protein
MADYCATSDIKADMPDDPLATTTDTTYDAAISVYITAASRLIDKEVGREADWFASTDSETRYFDGSGEDTTEIDEIHTLTSVAIAESGGTAAADYTAWVQDTDYYVSPYNYSALGLPINRLIADWNGDKSIFPDYRKAVKVTGQFGYSATAPEDIKTACKIQTMRWFRRSKQAWADASSNAQTGELIYAQSLDPDVRELLRSYIIGNMV